MVTETESIFADFDFKKRGGNSNFRILKELLLAQEKLETKIRQINNEYFELQQHVKEMEEKII